MSAALSRWYHATVKDGWRYRPVSYRSTSRKGSKAHMSDLETAYRKLYKEPMPQKAQVISIVAT